MNNIITLYHALDGHNETIAVFDIAGGLSEDLNAKYKSYKSFTNCSFEPCILWESVEAFIGQSSTYVAQRLRKEVDPEYREYLRLKEKFE